MKKIIAGIFLVLTAISLSGCSKKPAENAIEMKGNWVIDIDSTLRKAQAVGASNRDLSMVKEKFSGGRMNIDRERINLSIEGFTGSEAYEYKITEKEGNCISMQVKGASPGLKGANGRLKHCLNGNHLEVHDPATPLVTVYKRS